MRRFQWVLVPSLVLAVLLVLSASTARARETFPGLIDLPDGFQPEGVVVGRGPVIYAGSLADGAIYAADLRTGAGAILVAGQAGRVAVGLDFDRRTNDIFVAGGPTGSAHVYDAASGASVGEFTLTNQPVTFVNDVILTQDAAYFTDSFRPVFYKLPLGPGGRLPAPTAVEEIALSGDYQQVSGFNANGIEATPNGKDLIIVNSALGALYRVDPRTGVATTIDLGGGSVDGGDGLLLRGRTLYVVQGFSNQVAVVELAPDLSSGAIVGTITDPHFDIPTTVAGFAASLYVVNARFTTPPTPDTAYSIVRVPLAP